MPTDDLAKTRTEEELRQRVANSSQDPDDYRDLADFLLPLGLYDEIIALYQQALALPLAAFKKAQLSMELGWIHYNIGGKAQATLLAREALSFLSKEPKSSEALYCQGASHALVAVCSWLKNPQVGAETAQLALELLEQALADGSSFPDRAQAYIDAAQMHSLLGNVDKAIGYCETCLGREIKDIQTIFCLITYAQALQSAQRIAEAEHAIAEALHYGKSYKSGLLHNLYMEMGSIHRLANRFAESRASYEQALAALKVDPRFHSNAEILGEINYDLATVCYESADYQGAIATYTEVLRVYSKDTPSYWAAFYWMGRSYEAIEENSRARDCYSGVLESFVAAEDDKALARDGLMWVNAKLDYASGQYEVSAAAFEEIISRCTDTEADYWYAIVWLAASYEGLRAYEKAHGFYEKVLASSHSSEESKGTAKIGISRSLANRAYVSQEYKEAATKFEEVLSHYPETDPDHWDTLIWLGCCYQGLGAFGREQECYQKVLASRYAREKDKVLARRRFASSLGKASYESKNYGEAIAAFEEVLALCGDDHADRFHALCCLGYAYIAIHDETKACKCFEDVLASPNAPMEEKDLAREGLAYLRTV